MRIPVCKDHEQIMIAGMLNNDECYYDAVSETDEDYYTDENTKYLFTKLLNAQTRLNVNMLVKELDDPRLKSAARTYDGQWTSREEFLHSLQGMKDTYLKRQLYYTISKINNSFDEADAEQLIATMQNDISSYMLGGDDENFIFPEDRAPQALAELMERLENPEVAKGIPYSVTHDNGLFVGFPALDQAFYGAHGGDLIMIGAKTGEGKTAFALNLARLFSYRQDRWGYYMNTEMRKEEMEARLLAPIANVKANEFMRGVVEGTPSEIKDKIRRMHAAHETFLKSKLVMSRIPDLPLHKAQGLARQLKNRMPNLEYLIVDYVGRMSVKGFGGSSWDELYEITKQLKELAITLDIPIFILAQRNADGDVEGAKKMKNECDGVLFFEPITEDDERDMQDRLYSVNKDKVNYKITKQKVRRDDNPYPIYVFFDKARNYINEVW